MKTIITILLITNVLLSNFALAQAKKKNKNQDTVHIQPFPITDLIPLPKPDSTPQDYEYDTDTPDPLFRRDTSSYKNKKEKRIGAICADGTHSNATGRGACAGHGGVQQWLYASEQNEENEPFDKTTPKSKRKENIPDLSPTNYPQQSNAPSPNPITSVVEIFGQLAIATFIFLLLVLVLKKVIEKI